MAKCGDGKVNGAELCDTAIAGSAAGACPTSCPGRDACTPEVVVGTGCDAHCVAMPITEMKAGDGCCPPGADANQDGDCLGVCDNGVLEPGETCDPIASCPSCVSQNACLKAMTTGSAQTCTAACALVPVTTCVNGDQCCPSGCTIADDDDCPVGCGNGVLEAGETCEVAPSTTPCPASCNDQKACTTDVQTGSAANCNVVCTHTAIMQLRNGDGCCPMGVNANANTDNDCPAVCGNKIVEPNEQCDDGNQTAGDGCAACKTETPYQICLVKDGTNDACAQCSCMSCQNESLACHGDSNATTRALCNALVACGRAHGCTGNDCYCGTADFLTCLFGGGNGPCRSEVEAAAQSSDPGTISTRSTDTNYPVGRANALGSCASMSCATQCGL
jgi:cysteine-rich repeat protein